MSLCTVQRTFGVYFNPFISTCGSRLCWKAWNIKCISSSAASSVSRRNTFQNTFVWLRGLPFLVWQQGNQDTQRQCCICLLKNPPRTPEIYINNKVDFSCFRQRLERRALLHTEQTRAEPRGRAQPGPAAELESGTGSVSGKRWSPGQVRAAFPCRHRPARPWLLPRTAPAITSSSIPATWKSHNSHVSTLKKGHLCLFQMLGVSLSAAFLM